MLNPPKRQIISPKIYRVKTTGETGGLHSPWKGR